MTTVTTSGNDLAARLTALSRIVEFGADRVEPRALAEARQLLGRAGDRLALSGEHTVVALAGGTGSGKSTLFNAVCGLDLSPVGMRRPTTSNTHACVWGLEGSGQLLDWLGVQSRYRFNRASALDRDDNRLHGLILLDLPDHDSIRALTDYEADRMIGVADLIVWVLDPQKYADASVHRKYVTELAGHDAVTVFVLNQIDRLTPDEVAECVDDLRDLLRREGLENPIIVTTSALTRKGVDGFRSVVAQIVATRRASAQRIAADLERIVPQITPPLPPVEIDVVVDRQRRTGLTDALCDAVGVAAVADTVENVYAARSVEWVGWPYARWVTSLGTDPLRTLNLHGFRDDIRAGLTAASVSAQPAEVDNAVQSLVDGVSSGIPDNWRYGIRDIARANSANLPRALADELVSVAPRLDHVPGWWQLMRLWQFLLVLLAVVGVVWAGSLLLFGVPESQTPVPWVAAGVAVSLGLGLLTAVVSRNVVRRTAAADREHLEREMRGRVERIAEESVILPVEGELARYGEFHTALATVGAIQRPMAGLRG
ncbi:GTPase [Rhizohabitans arisaemae]|uniref:GTPase n=1 Tax=Rhizohabitans arisaemae TaxID=2720610 RepID=UPI0024B207B3|nr:GTPase [Rhizohabitans arisaemae]